MHLVVSVSLGLLVLLIVCFHLRICLFWWVFELDFRLRLLLLRLELVLNLRVLLLLD